jgi:hypothetical protein
VARGCCSVSPATGQRQQRAVSRAKREVMDCVPWSNLPSHCLDRRRAIVPGITCAASAALAAPSTWSWSCFGSWALHDSGCRGERGGVELVENGAADAGASARASTSCKKRSLTSSKEHGP